MSDALDLDGLEDEITGASEDINFDDEGLEGLVDEDEDEEDEAPKGKETGETASAAEPAPEPEPQPQPEADPFDDFFKRELGDPAQQQQQQAPVPQDQYVASLEQRFQASQQEATQLRNELQTLNQNVGNAFRGLQQEVMRLRQERDHLARYGRAPVVGEGEESDYARLYQQIEQGVQERVNRHYDPVVKNLGQQVTTLQRDIARRDHEKQINEMADQYKQEATQALHDVMGDKVSQQFSGRWGERMRQKVLARSYETGESFHDSARALHREMLEYVRDYMGESKTRVAPSVPKPPVTPTATGVAAKGGRQRVSQEDLERAGFEDHIDWADAGYPHIPPRRRKR